VNGGQCTVICAWHYARFDLATGQVVDGVASTGVPGYETSVRDGIIHLRERQLETLKAGTPS
jgi:nitrite reductase/ring-hydroxylating ferredoxin subunit